MAYLYHRIPENLSGDILYPLNELKKHYPEIYAEQVKKYEGREEVMDQDVPGLHCKWNDVLHLSAVDPRDIDAVVTKHGHPLVARRFLQIDPATLDLEHTVVYLYQHKTPETKFAPENWRPYNPADVARYSALPEEAISYYEESYANNERPLLWHRVPHILYKGTLDVRDHAVLEF